MMNMVARKTPAPTMPILVAVLLLLPLGAAWGQQAVMPGRSAGRVFLGMPRADVWKRLHPPLRHRSLRSSALPAPHRPGRYTVDGWGRGSRSLTVLYRNARVVQVEVNSPQFIAPGGVSVATPFAVLRRRFPRMRVDEYGMIQTLRDGTPSDALSFYADDVKRGIAFTTGTQDDQATYDELPGLKPDSLIVHRPGRPVLPVEAASDTRVTTEPHSWNDFLPAIRAWFAGGPHQKITKGGH